MHDRLPPAQRRGLIASVVAGAASLCASGNAQTPPLDWSPVPALEARSGHAAVYDVSRGRVVLFGGRENNAMRSYPRDDTWEWDGTQWLLQQPARSPSAREGHALAHDFERGRTFLSGGADPAALGDLWVYDGSTWLELTWGSLPPRSGHAMAYDVARRRLVVFGGRDSTGGFMPGTWEWDGANWAQLSPSTSPSPRAGHDLVYDVLRRRVVLFGGDSATGRHDDTWEWDGTSWTQASPATVPPRRAGHAMTYDPHRQRTVMFGGTTWAGVLLDDLWEWDGTNWSRRTIAGPTARSEAVLAYDLARRTLVLFGGLLTPARFVGDTWEADASGWSDRGARTPSNSASAWVRMAYDAVRQRVVMMTANGPRSETWEWDGAQWSARRPTTVPNFGFGDAIAYDLARRNTVLFTRAWTWTWDGVDWTLHPVVLPSRDSSAMAYDAARQRVVLFGGYADGRVLDETWEWDGVTWTQRQPANRPPPRHRHAMAFDASRRRVVLYGGIQGWSGNGLDDTWEWDGTNWLARQPSQKPPPMHGHAMAYDLRRSRVMAYGGIGRFELWAWDGTAWTLVPATDLGPRWLPGFAYDIARDQFVMYGGLVGPYTFGSTWLFGPTIRSAHQPIGFGCGASVPMLTSNAPRLGNSGFVLDLLRARPNAPSAFGLSLGNQSLALGGGCTLYLREPILPLFGSTNAFGFVSVNLSLPPDPVLRGLTLYAQGFVADPQGPVLGTAFSAGRRLVIGD